MCLKLQIFLINRLFSARISGILALLTNNWLCIFAFSEIGLDLTRQFPKNPTGVASKISPKNWSNPGVLARFLIKSKNCTVHSSEATGLQGLTVSLPPALCKILGDCSIPEKPKSPDSRHCCCESHKTGGIFKTQTVIKVQFSIQNNASIIQWLPSFGKNLALYCFVILRSRRYLRILIVNILNSRCEFTFKRKKTVSVTKWNEKVLILDKVWTDDKMAAKEVSLWIVKRILPFESFENWFGLLYWIRVKQVNLLFEL